MKHPTPRLRLSSVLLVAVGLICAGLFLASAANAWAQFQVTRAVVAAELGRMP